VAIWVRVRCRRSSLVSVTLGRLGLIVVRRWVKPRRPLPQILPQMALRSKTPAGTAVPAQCSKVGSGRWAAGTLGGNADLSGAGKTAKTTARSSLRLSSLSGPGQNPCSALLLPPRAGPLQAPGRHFPPRLPKLLDRASLCCYDSYRT